MPWKERIGLEKNFWLLLIYCRISFGTITGSNPKVHELSRLLNRTAGAVAMKLCNFARFDQIIKQEE
jgi:hypothetical protein